MMLYILYLLDTAIVLSVATYALQSLAGQLSIGDKVDSLFRKAFGEDLVAKLLVLTLTCSYQLFRKMSDVRHCLHALLPKQRHSKLLNSLRSRGHNYVLPQTESTLFKNSFLNRCLFSYI